MEQKQQAARVSLAVLIASAITLGMLILAIVLVTQSFRGMEQAKVAAAETTARQLARTVDDRIRAIIRPPELALALLRHDPVIRRETPAERLGRMPIISEVLDSSEIISAAYVGYDNGDFFLLRKILSSGSVQFPDAPPDSHYLLQSLERDGGQSQGVWQFYDRELQLLEQRNLDTYDYDPRSRPWYQAAQADTSPKLSSPYVFFTTGETGLTLSQQSSVPGTVFGLDVSVADLGHRLATLKQTRNSRIAIVNTDGELLADAGGLVRPDEVISELIQQSAEGQLRRLHLEGKDWYGIAFDLVALPDDPLRILVAIPANELLADVWAALARQTFVAILIALLLLVLGWFIGRQVGKPLERLTDRVSSFSQFRFDTPMRSDSHIREAAELGVALDDMARTIRSFQSIATVLNRGQDLDQLLHDILQQLVNIVGEHQGAVYLYRSRERQLELAASQNMTPLGQIPDVAPEVTDAWLIQHLRHQLGGQPVVAILRNRSEKLIGALVIEIEHHQGRSLSTDLIVFVEQIAGSAAVAIETRELIESQQALLDGIIRLVANAIDAKSPYTGGHCERVPKLAHMLAEQAEQSNEGSFAGFHMSDDERYEFHLAAWLHDCGKITSPEYVVDKAVKLETIYNRIHEIRTRFEVLHRDAEIHCLRAILDGADPEQARAQRDAAQARLRDDFAFLARANQGSEGMADADIERIIRLAAQTWTRHFSDRLGLSDEEERALAGHPEPPLPATENLLADKPGHLRPWGNKVPPVQPGDPANRWGFDMKLPAWAYNHGEIHNLTVRSGTLTEEERFKINEHIVQTICMLDALPLPDRLSRVPRLAGTHHERVDGKGYPHRLHGSEMSIAEKIMAVPMCLRHSPPQTGPIRKARPFRNPWDSWPAWRQTGTSTAKSLSYWCARESGWTMPAPTSTRNRLTMWMKACS